MSPRLSRLARPSKVPHVMRLDPRFPAGSCCICGKDFAAGDEVLGRAYDLRITCVGCPWTAEMISERTR